MNSKIIDVSRTNTRDDSAGARDSRRSWVPTISGKSTALRFFFEFRTLLSNLVMRDLASNASNPVSELWTGGASAWPGFPSSVRDPNEVFHNANDRPISIRIGISDPEDGEVEALQLTLGRPSAGLRMTMKVFLYSDGQTVEFSPRSRSSFGAMEDGRWKNKDNTEVLLDANRIIRAFAEMANSLYIGPFRNAIHSGGASYYDLQIGHAFIDQWREFKTGSNVSNNLAANRLTEEIRRVFGFDRLEINAAANGETLQLFVDDQSYVLAELGAGLSQFVMLLAFVATRSPSLVLIDEPELNLHPLLQPDLLLSLKNYANGPVVFSTHSLGLARTVAQDIYVCQKHGLSSTLAPLSGHPRLTQLLGELSFGGYQELGFSKLLLVEGPHDVTTIRELLRKFGKEHQMVLLPLGGASMINRDAQEQLEELRRITPDITAVVDSERESETTPPAPNVVGFAQACTAASIPCHVLERRALEHYLTLRAIQAVKGPNYRNLKGFEDFRSLEPGWSKADNSAIAREMTREELFDTDLGQFLEEL